MLSPKDLDVPVFEDFWWNDETSDGDDKKGSGENGGESPRTATGEDTGFEENSTQKPKEFESLVFGDGVSTEKESGISTISTDIYIDQVKPKNVEKHLDIEFLLKNKTIRALHDKTFRTMAQIVLVNEITLKSVTKSIRALFEQTPGVVLSSHDVVNLLFCLHVKLHNVPATNRLKSDMRKKCSTVLTILSSTSYLHTRPTAHRRNPGYVLPAPDTPASRLQHEFVLRCRLCRRLETLRTTQTRLLTVCRRLFVVRGVGRGRGAGTGGEGDGAGGRQRTAHGAGRAAASQDGRVPIRGPLVSAGGGGKARADRGSRTDTGDGGWAGLTGGRVASQGACIDLGGCGSDGGMKAGKHNLDEASNGFDKSPTRMTLVSCWSRVQDRMSQGGGSDLNRGGKVR